MTKSKATRKEFGKKTNKSRKRATLWSFIIFGIIFLGIGIALAIDLINEFKKNNVGTFEITLTDSGTNVLESAREIELVNVKIGQIEVIKFNFVLTSVNHQVEYEDEAKLIPKENGVYVRVKLSGQVFDVSESGEKSLNSIMTNKMSQIIINSPPASTNWRKEGNYYYFVRDSSEEYDSMLVKERENIYSTADIMVLFDPSIVSGEWFDKVIKIKVELEAIDSLSSSAISWR